MKHQISSTKSQTISNDQNSNCQNESETSFGFLKIRILDLFGVWDL